MQAMLLTYHFNAKKSAKLRMLAMKLGIRVKAVEKWEYLSPVGSFTGQRGAFESMYDGADFAGEMLVMANFSQQQLDTFLSQLRAALPPVALKAVLTDTNAGWNSLELHDELVREHAAMQNGAPAHTQDA